MKVIFTPSVREQELVEALAASEARERALREKLTWRPIETAPKDGETAVLTYRGAGLISVAVYFPHGKAEWCVTDGMHLLNVTHWLPLPDAPASETGDGR